MCYQFTHTGAEGNLTRVWILQGRILHRTWKLSASVSWMMHVRLRFPVPITTSLDICSRTACSKMNLSVYIRTYGRHSISSWKHALLPFRLPRRPCAPDASVLSRTCLVDDEVYSSSSVVSLTVCYDVQLTPTNRTSPSQLVSRKGDSGISISSTHCAQVQWSVV